MPIKSYSLIAALICAGAALWLFGPWAHLTWWISAQQLDIQNAMARALRAVNTGEPAALLVLCAATASYGALHAIGPGHGKILIGGAALASGATLRRLAILTLLSSIAQAGTAILIVGTLVFALRINSQEAATLTETWLAPISLAAMAGIGATLALRGLRMRRKFRQETASSGAHHHDDDCGCGHAHGPDVATVHALRSPREGLAIIISIALRPCTGALFVLVISARFDIFHAGVLAVLAMALGTAATTFAIASGGRIAHLVSAVGHGAGTNMALRLSSTLHIIGGGVILAPSLIALFRLL
jgi:ABC-type nickel/cobalt efflux system permease component RcnA